jgi:peptide/nickel transport system permease protein
MARYVGRRLVTTVPVLLFVSVAVFLMVHLTPGDPVKLMLGEDAGPEAVAALQKDLGLDQPLVVQYGRWLGHVLTGDFGRSIRTNQPVSEAILTRLPVTLELAVLAMLFAVAVGLPTGILAAIKRNSPIDTASTTVALLGISLPSFFVGILLILLLAQEYRLLPPSGYVPLREDPVQNLKLMIMPALALGAALAGILSRMMRSSLLEVLGTDYIRTARAKGMNDRRTIVGHALKNALLPVVTVLGLQTGALLGGAILTETIFALPGIGRLIVDSIFARDFPMVQGVVLFLALVRIASNLLADITYVQLDPRISYG